MKPVRSLPARRCIRCLAGLLASLAAFTFSLPASAQDFPKKPITIIWPYTPGGPDRVIRLVAQKMQESLGQPVLVDSRPGASGLVGAQYVRRAAPDGYTVLVASNSGMVVLPLMSKPVPFHVETDFEAVSPLYDFSTILTVPPTLPVTNLRGLIDYAKKNPDKANYGSPGAASLARLVTEAFKQQSGTAFQHIAYKGIGDAQAALMAGDIQLFVDGPQSANELIKAGKVKALAVTGKRLPGLPNVPTFKEEGIDNMDMSVWIGMFAPKGTPPAIVKLLSDEVTKAVNAPDVKEQISQGGLANPLGGPPARLTALIAAETPQWSKLIKDLKLTLD